MTDDRPDWEAHAYLHDPPPRYEGCEEAMARLDAYLKRQAVRLEIQRRRDEGHTETH